MIRTGEYGRFSLDEAEIGDKLMVSGAGGSNSYHAVTITAVTKARITTSDGSAWMRSSQRLVGADRWSRMFLYAYDEALIQEYEHKELRECLVRKITGSSFSNLDMDALKRIAAIIDGEPKNAKSPEEERAA